MSVNLTNPIQQSKRWAHLGRINPKTGSGLFDRLNFTGEQFLLRLVENTNANMTKLKDFTDDTDWSVDYNANFSDSDVKRLEVMPYVIERVIPLQLERDEHFMRCLRDSMDKELKLKIEQEILYGQSDEGTASDNVRGVLAEAQAASTIARVIPTTYSTVTDYVTATNGSPLFSADGRKDLLYTDATYPDTPEMISYDPFTGKWSNRLNLNQYYDEDDMVVRMNADNNRLDNSGTKLLGAYFNPTAFYALGDGEIREVIKYDYTRNAALIERRIDFGGAFVYLDSIRAVVNSTALKTN